MVFLDERDLSLKERKDVPQLVNIRLRQLFLVLAPCLTPIERRKIAALQLLSFPSLLLEEIEKVKVIPNPQDFSLSSHT